jgi:2-polyprenyl-6-methoxyphenol hydroxylase-like FAD-dependent oxidoreductase
MSVPATTTVVVVGGGPVGLAASIMLSSQQPPISHVLFEQYPGTSIHPKSVGVNQRTAEIFRRLGIADRVYAAGAPIARSRRTAWYTSLGPDGKEICSRPSWGGGDKEEIYERAGPSRYGLCAQIWMDPILAERAQELNPNGVFFNHEVTDISEPSHSNQVVIVRVLNRKTQQESTVAARYVLVCDGGRSHSETSFASKLGVEWEGESDVMNMMSAHIRSPITKYHPDPRVFLSWFINPKLGGSINTGYLYHLGPYPKDGEGYDENETWCFACGINPNEPEHFTEQYMRDRMDAVLRIPELEATKSMSEGGLIEILTMSHWRVNSKVIKHYRTKSGKIFFLGDAAHRIPPWGALGMNTGVQDADNLIWKLAVALQNPQANWDGLLNSYEQERRDIGARVARTSLENLRSHGLVLDTAIGISPAHTVEENVAAMKAYFDADSKHGEPKRAAVRHALDVLDLEFYAHGLEIGWFYPSADLEGEAEQERHAGQVDEEGHFDPRVYHASTLPGHHVPHAWLERDGSRKSTRDWTGRNGFIVFANDEGWKVLQGNDKVAEIVVIGKDGKVGQWKNVDRSWSGFCGIGDTGAVVMRPDGIVSWRWKDNEFLRGENLIKSWLHLLDRILQNASSTSNGMLR